MSATLQTPHTAHGFAGRTLFAVRHLTIEQQMEEISARITDGEYDGVPTIELNVLRNVWQLLFNRLYGFTTVH